MLAIDDIVVFPFKSLLMVFREIYNAAVQELEQEGDRIRLETGNIDEATFDERERDLLDRLDELEARQAESEIDEESTSEVEEQEQEEDEDDAVGSDVYLLSSRQEP